MGTTLVIVESPGKCKKLEAILGAGHRVSASVGHVRDLPEHDMGVSPPDFRPQYRLTDRGEGVVAGLKRAAAGAERVLLATDPDREGEAIAWHLAQALGLENPERITFQSITKSAVKAAMAAPRTLDMDLVRAQEARRVLDRLVGYTISDALSVRNGQKMHAGRVQSPAVRLVVDRERSIKAFKPVEHFGVRLKFEGGWSADWDFKPMLQKGVERMTDRAFAEKVSRLRWVHVVSLDDGKDEKGPAAPFTTSTLQQAASARLKMKPKAAMEAAQKLYEQGAITYHRTDSPNVSDEGYEQLADYARARNLPLAKGRRKWPAKEGAQEAHEAIRPTHFEDRDASEDDKQRALYRLIWSRAVASQLCNAVYAVRTMRLRARELVDGKVIEFVARGTTLTDPGWKAVYEDNETEVADAKGNADDDAPERNPVPRLGPVSQLVADKGELLVKQTKAPARFTLATLVKEMERLGIGRPSTYAAIMDGIVAHGYIAESSKGALNPLPAGEMVVDSLVGACGFIDLNYTRGLEDRLDGIATGKEQYLPVVSSAYTQIAAEAEKLSPGVVAARQVIHPCPSCSRPLRRIPSAKGVFWGCTGFPSCEVTFADEAGKPGASTNAPLPRSEHPCPGCGEKSLVRRTKPGEYDFYSCQLKACGKTFDVGGAGEPVERQPKPQIYSEHSCPGCKKQMLVRRTKKGVGGYDFYSCQNKECDKTFDVGIKDRPAPRKAAAKKFRRAKK